MPAKSNNPSPTALRLREWRARGKPGRPAPVMTPDAIRMRRKREGKPPLKKKKSDPLLTHAPEVSRIPTMANDPPKHDRRDHDLDSGKDVCPECNGKGIVEGDYSSSCPCPLCDGEGELEDD